MYIFFDGCGLLITYYVGVVKALEKHAKINFKTVQLGGVSGGVLIAMMLSLGLTYKDIKRITNDLIKWQNNNHYCFNIKPYFDQCIHYIKNRMNHIDLDMISRNITNLHVRVTVFNGMFPKELIISRFQSFNDLIRVVEGSCNIIPFFNGFRFVYDECGRKLVDGGFCMAWRSIFHDKPNNITISPLRLSTISPYNNKHRPFSYWNVIIPTSTPYRVAKQGYNDTICFLYILIIIRIIYVQDMQPPSALRSANE